MSSLWKPFGTLIVVFLLGTMLVSVLQAVPPGRGKVGRQSGRNAVNVETQAELPGNMVQKLVPMETNVVTDCCGISGPDNDTCSGAVPLSSTLPVTQAINNDCACPFNCLCDDTNDCLCTSETEFVSPCADSFGSDIWYTWTNTSTSTAISVLVDTCGTTCGGGACPVASEVAGPDTVVSVYQGECTTDLVSVACDDDCSVGHGDPVAVCADEVQTNNATRDACTCIDVAASEMIFIRVQGFAGDMGDITLNLSQAGTACSEPTGACCTMVGSTATCTEEVLEISCLADVNFTAFHLGDSCPPSEECPVKGCCCDGGGNCFNSSILETQCLNNYPLAWWTTEPNCTNGPPSNDECWEADLVVPDHKNSPLNVGGFVVLAIADTTKSDSTEDAGGSSTILQFCDSQPPDRAVWYKLVGVGEGPDVGSPSHIEVTTCSSSTDFDTTVHVYCTRNCIAGDQSCCRNELSCMRGNDNKDGVYDSLCDTVGLGENSGSSVQWCADPASTYYIAVGGTGGETGMVEVTVKRLDDSCTPSTEENFCEPTGACCKPDGTCLEDILESGCVGDFFAGSTCSAACQGACCHLYPDNTVEPVDCFDQNEPNFEELLRTTLWYCRQEAPIDGFRFYYGQDCSATGGSFTCPVCGNGTVEMGEECDPLLESTGVCDAVTCQIRFDQNVCGTGSTESCCLAHSGTMTVGCQDNNCCLDVCDLDPSCCNEEWDDYCADLALEVASCTSCTGVCCESFICSDPRLKTECTASEIFVGPGEVCANSPCDIGACCTTSGCDDSGDLAACDTAGGMYQGWGSRCKANTCLGACCDGVDCTTTSSTDCAATYMGVGTTCFPNTCDLIPANDECAAAEVITLVQDPQDPSHYSATIDLDNTFATTNMTSDLPIECAYANLTTQNGDFLPDYLAMHTVWYKFTPPAGVTEIQISTCGTDPDDPNSAVDTVIALYDDNLDPGACPTTRDSMVACGENGCPEIDHLNPKKQARFCYTGLTVAYTYYIQVGISPRVDNTKPGKIRLELDTNHVCGMCCGPLHGEYPGGNCYNWPPYNPSDDQYITKEFCDSLLGIFLPGTGNACTDCYDGACCLTSGCEDKTDGGCFSSGGEFLGQGTRCSTSLCPPTNDVCGGAISLSCDSQTILYNTLATESASDPLFSCRQPETGTGFGTLWYQFVVPASTPTQIRIDTCDSTTDTILGIYDSSGCPIDTTQDVGCSDDDCGARSEIVLDNPTGSAAYYIQVASWSDENQGEIVLNIDCFSTSADSNDTCATATTAAVPSSPPAVSTVRMVATSAPACGGGINGPGAWYKVTGTGNTMKASVCNSTTDFDTRLSLYCEDCADLFCLDSNDDTVGCGFQSEIEWCSESGNDYWILVHGFAGATGSFQLDITDDLTACPAPAYCRPSPPTTPSFLADTPEERYNFNKVRYLSVEPNNPGVPTAIRVTLIDLPSPFDVHIGNSYWVDTPIQVCENGGEIEIPPGGCGPAPGAPRGTYWVAALTCTPVYLDWEQSTCDTNECTGGLAGGYCSTDADCKPPIHIFDKNIVPGSSFELRSLTLGSDPLLESNYSTPTVIDTSIWGDVVGDDSLEAPDDSVDIISDVTLSLDKFRNSITGPLKSQADIEPAEVDFQVNISDVTFVLNAFASVPYPFTGPGDMTPPCE